MAPRIVDPKWKGSRPEMYLTLRSVLIIVSFLSYLVGSRFRHLSIESHSAPAQGGSSSATLVLCNVNLFKRKICSTSRKGIILLEDLFQVRVLQYRIVPYFYFIYLLDFF